MGRNVCGAAVSLSCQGILPDILANSSNSCSAVDCIARSTNCFGIFSRNVCFGGPPSLSGLQPVLLSVLQAVPLLSLNSFAQLSMNN